jgi:hypothetical protein
MVAGGSLPGQVPNTFVGDLSTGIVEALDFGLGTRRLFPTITAFRAPGEDPSPALIAGGEDPDTHGPIGTAEIYLPKPGTPGDLGDFGTERIDLSEPRTKHGAVVLANGTTLLVGGVGQLGLPLATMEIVDPRVKPPDRRVKTNGVALLATARANPIVLRLASGEIMVAGGTDKSHAPVPTIEWFSADAKVATKRPVALVTGRERAFVPLAAGGALAVVAPSGTPTDFLTVWVISADGAIEPGLPVDPTTLDVVRLFPGTEGAPVLWTGQRWLRWQPWFGAFQPISDAPQPAPADRPQMAAIASGDEGLALWLDARIEGQLYVNGYRFATRSRFGNVQNPMLLDSPAGLAPDRLTGTPGSSVRFVPGGGLELGPGASAFVTDLTYADVTVEVDGGGAAPLIVLRQESGREIEVGGAGCGFALSATTKIHVERVGPEVSVRFDDGAPRLCPSTLDDGARVTIGVRGPQGSGSAVARNLRVNRR